MRVGFGYDVHKFSEGRKLILGGVEIPHSLGLLGHSDADVLLHAIADALLGAAALGDIGIHFPDNDSAYKDIDSMILLKRTVDLLKDKGYDIINIDATVVAQKPKISPHSAKMKENIAKCLGIDPDFVNIKATTTEKLGFEGREEGISSHCICLIEKRKDVK
ncbi:MAG: 2-C-methyl-D-erythritol 2,4-cyclodiphosphate synthase [Clostridia bacterium]|nr:2-C-methyl-D-erythritol 2,4-cyclodiphosphate synthase [Clostridia bacterium]